MVGKRKEQIQVGHQVIRKQYVWILLKNYPCPNIATNDAYYRRQSSVYAFNTNVLSDSRCIFYLYPQTVANKGSDEVA